MYMSLPTCVHMYQICLVPEECIEVAINSGVTDKYKLFVIVENVQDARRMVEGCQGFERVNLGNVRMGAKSKQLGTTVFVSEQDMEDIRVMQAKGSSVDVQSIPRDKCTIVKL